ncbi:MAG: aldehyde ferredoxin oxidoreductase family protein [Chloroflexota bacterium]
MTKGYNNRILRVNLSTGTTTTEVPTDEFERKWIGGAGFGTYFLFTETKAGIDPLGPDNKLMMMAGPLTGYPFSGSGRNNIVTKSPLTMGYAKSEVGGFFGAEMRRAGFDGIIIEGKSPKPVYLLLHEGQAEIKDASRLWGKTTKETEEMIREENSDKGIRVASIGPAGENLIRFACIMNDLKEAAGRGGTGAVMGSKNLKAVAARGSKAPEAVRPEAFTEMQKWFRENPKAYALFSTYGTGAPAMMAAMIPQGNLPIRNFVRGDFPTEKIDGGTLKNTVGIGMEGCYGCLVRCKKVVKVDEPNMKIDPSYGGPEYETLGALGSVCGVEDMKAICKGNEMCGAYSLDTISMGDTVGFAMECYEKGLLTSKDTGGIELKWGSGEAMLRVIEMVCRREGIGDLLAEGTRLAARKIGGGAEAFTMDVKGVNVPMHDPRAKGVLGLGYSINPHGADHCFNVHDTGYTAPGPMLTAVNQYGFLEPMPALDLSPTKVQLLKFFQNVRMVMDSAVICQFPPYSNDQVIELLKASTGWNTGILELQKFSERVLTLARMYNLREGLSTADDKLPKRFFQQHVGGPSEKNPPYLESEFEKAKAYYYRIMGWDEKGVPTPETLSYYGLSFAMKK